MLSTISIIGTALAMAMIIALVFIFEIETSNCQPEINRDRTLYVKYIVYKSSVGSSRSSSFMSPTTLKACFYPLRKEAEAVSGLTMWTDPILISTQDGQTSMRVPYIATDADIWKLFSYRFLKGSPFTEEEFISGVNRIVISDRVALKCFGTVSEAVGRTLQFNYRDYTVCGVVANVSTLVTYAYADVWIPYTSLTWQSNSEMSQVTGNMCCLILARSSQDFATLCTQANQLVNQYNAGLKEGDVDLMGQPINHLLQLTKISSNQPANPYGVAIFFGIICFILLLVPAINLSGLTISRMKSRTAEIGIRKAFGATRWNILQQVLLENFLLTLIGGVVGVFFGYMAFSFGAHWIVGNKIASMIGYTDPVNIYEFQNLGQIFKAVFSLTTLGGIFLFCLILNLMSATIPAWQTAKNTIVNALNEQK